MGCTAYIFAGCTIQGNGYLPIKIHNTKAVFMVALVVTRNTEIDLRTAGFYIHHQDHIVSNNPPKLPTFVVESGRFWQR